MKAKSKKDIEQKLPRVLNKDGSFLLEAMIGTAILSIVLVFFATVSVSAFLLMGRAYQETQIMEEVFAKIESRQLKDPDPAKSLSFTKSSSPIAGGDSLVMGTYEVDSSNRNIYIKYVTADGKINGSLPYEQLQQNTLKEKKFFSKKLYAFRYEKSNDDNNSTFYILKGEK